MYYIDTQTRRVDCLDYDPDTGDIRNRRPLIEDCPPGGAPDGMTVDADGCLWIAYFGGWCVRRYTPDGRLDREIPCPVSRPTSCTFGGADLDTLYITSDSRPRAGHDPAQEPHAGGLFACRPGVTGLSARPYEG
jgi:sugar lactone lactonase YvrE